MATITIPHSFIEVVSPNLADGFYLTNITDAVTGEQVLQDTVTVSNGQASVKVDMVPNMKLKVVMDDGLLPPLFAEVAYAETIGDIEMFANETLRVYEGFWDYNVAELINGTRTRTMTHELDNGARVTVMENGRLTLSTNGAFDHLDPGEHDLLRLPYTTEPEFLSDDYWAGGTSDVEVNGSWNEVTSNVYEPTSPPDEFTWMAAEPLQIGATYVLDVSTLMSAGSIDMNWVFADGSIGSTFSRYNLTINDRYTRESWPVPENAQGIRFRTTSSFNGTIEVHSLKRIEPAPVHYLDFRVKASEEVSAKLVSPAGFNGSGWSFDSDSYTPQPGTSTKLSANANLLGNRIYEIAATVTGRTAGSIRPAITGDTTVSGQYSLDTDDREVWYIQAPLNPTAVHIERTADFDGVVSKIYVRQLLLDGVDDPRDLVITNPQPGQLKLKPLVAPKAGRRSDAQPPALYFTGELNFTGEFGVRITDQTSYVVENAHTEAKRSGISTKGGDWAEIWNVSVLGGYDGNGSKYQTGIIVSDNEPWMDASYIYNCEVDLLLPPMVDNYVSQNSDGYLFNSNHKVSARRVSAYMVNNLGKNVSDGVIDNKVICFVNQCEFEGGHRTIRGHTISQYMLASTILTEQDDSECAIHAANTGERVNLWNSIVNGERVRSVKQLREQIKPAGRKYAGKSALEGDQGATEAQRACSVLKTFPRMPAEARLRISHWQWQISPAGQNAWSDLIASDGLFEPGTLTRFVDVSPGTYDLRFKAWHGEYAGNWVYSDTVTVA